MTQIPRKSTFPPYMIQKLIAKIQNDVEEDVIPVSTGIYSYEKLKNKLEAISKPEIQNYQDRIFFEVVEDKIGGGDKTGEKCSNCEEQYNLKKNPPIMCNFCAIYCCLQCKPTRQRPHPLSKDGSGKRYNICQRCDTRYLNLQLSHSYVQNRTLLQQAIVKTSQQLQSLISRSQQYQQTLNKSKQIFQKSKFKISQLRKQKLQLTKSTMSKLPQQLKQTQQKHEILKVNFVKIHLKHREWLQFNHNKLKEKEERQKQRIEREKQTRYELQRVQQRQNGKKRHQEDEQNELEEELRRRQRELQQQQSKQRKLGQNSTLNVNINGNSTATSYSQKKNSNNSAQNGYDNIRRQESQQDQSIRSRQASKISIQRSEAILQQQLTDNRQSRNPYSNSPNLSPKRAPQIPQTFVSMGAKNVSPNSQKQKQIQKIFSQQKRQQKQFDEYFTGYNQQYNTQFYHNQYDSPIKELYKDSTIKKSLEREQDIEKQVNKFTFSDSKLERLQPQQQDFLYGGYGRKKSQNFNENDVMIKPQENQFSFGDNQNKHQEEHKIQLAVQNPSNLTRENHGEQQQNKLSFSEEWYINKNMKEPQKLYSLLRQQQNKMSKTRKSSQQLEEQCQKSTSQLDQDQLQVARYSLIKAARDQAVQQRQRNKIYQQSIHQAPYDQQQQGVGQVKKCQCTIF